MRSTRYEPLAQQIVSVSEDRMVLERAEHVVAELFVEWPRLETCRVEVRALAFAFDSVLLRGGQEPLAVVLPAERTVHPEDSEEIPVAPDIAERAANDFTVVVLQEEIRRRPGLLRHADRGARVHSHATVDSFVDILRGVGLEGNRRPGRWTQPIAFGVALAHMET